MIKYDFCIVGAGASGMAAAITAARSSAEGENLNICILEKNEKPGRKLLATGNGRCNISNTNCEDYEEVRGFFAQLGIPFREEGEGRVYPYSGQASSVVEALLEELERLNVDILLSREVEDIEYHRRGEDGCFCLKTRSGQKPGETIEADRVMIATGGKSAPAYGTTGDGYLLAAKLGHKVSRLAPVLTSVETLEDTSSASKARVQGRVTLYKNGEKLAEEEGEIQFTDKGLSGICIFNLTRFIKLDEGETFAHGFKKYTIELNLAPDISEEELTQMLLCKLKNGADDIAGLLLGIVPGKVSAYLGGSEKLFNEKELQSMNDEKCRHMAQNTAEALKSITFGIKGPEGWKKAQCTSGGVSLQEVDSGTMESLLVKNLFFGGEVLDYDGPCGGYNLQNAWITGIKCGRTIGTCTD